MAVWNRQASTLQLKVVYDGPVRGGKTTNLEALQALLGEQRAHPFLSTRTRDDRTLLFDLLTLELGDVLDHVVSLHLFAVPGQVRHEATRKVILRGADAVVFVADARRGREDHNRWSLQNLRLNLRSQGMDPSHFPVTYQANKQDAGDAAAEVEVATWLGVTGREVVPASTRRGEGVIEVLAAAVTAALVRASTEEGAPPHVPGRNRLERRVRELLTVQAPGAASAPGRELPRSGSMTFQGVDLLESSIEAGLALAVQLAETKGRLRRLESEMDALRRARTA